MNTNRVFSVTVLVLYVMGMYTTFQWARNDGAAAECHAQYAAQVASLSERVEQQTVQVDSLLRAIDNRQRYYSQGGR